MASEAVGEATEGAATRRGLANELVEGDGSSETGNAAIAPVNMGLVTKRDATMAMRWCYLGSVGPRGKLDWNASAGGNIPPNKGLPDIDDTSFYIEVMHLAMNGCYHGCSPDFDSYALKVSGTELVTIIQDYYKKHPEKIHDTVIKQYLDYARSMPPRSYVALAAVAM